MKYFNNSVEGIRGIAIIFVILFHSNIKYFSNCFIGVDLTFLLSGYLLMKSYLYGAKENSNYIFYLKRFYRISTSFSLMLLFMFIYHISNGINELRLIKEYLYSCLFYSNVYFKNEYEDYFFIINPSKLLHTWSLSIEIQFYILFSFFTNVYQKNITVFTFLIIITTFISFLYEIYNVYRGNRSIYYSFIGRLWEFSIGIITAMNKLKYNRSINSDLLVILLISIPFINIKINISILRVIELLICLCILENENKCCEENSEEKKVNKSESYSVILNNRILKHVGKLSYTLYLIHYPILTTKYNIYSKIIITILLGNIFYKIIDYSFNSLKTSKKQRMIIILLLFLLPFIPIVIFYLKFNLLSSYLIINSSDKQENEQMHSKINISSIPPNVLSQYKSLRLDLHSFDNPLNYSKIEYLHHDLFLYRLFQDTYIKTDINEESEVWMRKPIAYIIGDSYCMQWMGVVKKYCAERNITLIYSQILVKDFIKSTAKEFMKNIILEDMIIRRNIHFDVIFVAFSLSVKRYANIQDKLNVQYPILINSLSKYADEIIAFEGTPHTDGEDNQTSMCNLCVSYKKKYCYAILGKNFSYSEHFEPIHLSNYHILDFYEKQFCYNNICSCVINNLFVYDCYKHINPSVLKLFQNEFEEHADYILKGKFKKVREYDEKDKKSLYVIGFLIQSAFMNFIMK